MTIRSATAADFEAVATTVPVVQHAPAREMFLRQQIEQGRCWVAETQGEVLGFLVLDYSFYGNGFVSLLAVRNDSRRRGVGSTLLRHAITTCSTAKLFTSTNESNTAMRSLLRKEGFEPSGIIHNLDDGDPELVFLRRLRGTAL